ncbi:hypothetical protein, partial [Cupriavidus oxalaticus]|uniref:hypothetical protein n=1 Tax=Cupriavidus oxalaticus TaxID=96344 RepID=UPI0031815CF8
VFDVIRTYPRVLTTVFRAKNYDKAMILLKKTASSCTCHACTADCPETRILSRCVQNLIKIRSKVRRHQRAL